MAGSIIRTVVVSGRRGLFLVWPEKITKKGDDKTNIALRYTTTTEVLDCPTPLKQPLLDITNDDASNARVWSRMPKGIGHPDIAGSIARWFSLSVCELLTPGTVRRQLDTLAQVPSTLISLVGDSITYMACASCPKGAPDGQKTCDCSTPDTTPRWKAHLRLQDNTGSLVATAFDVVESLAKIFADGEEEKCKIEYFHSQPSHVDDLFWSIAAIPFTVLLSFQDSEYSERIETYMRKADVTFHPDPTLLRHPRKSIL